MMESLHRAKELGYRLKEILEAGDLDRFGLSLDEHWENKKKRSSKITAPQIDFWAAVSDVCVIIPTVTPERITPHTESFQALVWHLLVSHPEVKISATKWESIG